MKRLKNLLINKQFELLIFFVILLHLIFIDLKSINFEYVFVEGSDFIKNNFEKSIVENFFSQQANTFFFSFLVSFFSFFLPFINSLYIGKIISMTSYFFLGFGLINFINKDISKTKIYENKYSFIFILLFLNPLIWIFGYRATPDLISGSIGFYSFSLIYRYFNKNLKIVYFSCFLMGFATALKPIVGIYFLMSLTLVLPGYTKEKFKILINLGLFYSLIPLVYFSLIYFNFGFLLFTPYYQSVLSPVQSIEKYLSNWILYSSFLFIFLLPIISGRVISFFLSLRNKIIFILINLVFYYLGSKFLLSSVEMNFGIISNFINKNILNGLLSIFSFNFICILLFEVKKNYVNSNYSQIKIILISLLYIFILSFSLPSQRYLILIIPIFYIIFYEYHKNLINFIFVLIVCVPLNFILLGNHYLTATLSNELYEIIKKNVFLENVCPGVISSHIANYFSVEDRKSVNCYLKKYHIVKGINENSIYSVQRKFLFISKSYSLIKVR